MSASNLPENKPTAPEDEAQAEPRSRKRRRWPWVIVAILVLLILLVLLAPMIASTAPVRSMVVGQINNNLNGSVQIADWSLGWLSGVEVGGVKVYDENKALVLEVDHLKTGLSLLDAIRGNYNLGETIIEVNLTKMTINADGTINYQKLAKSAPQPAQNPAGSGETPAKETTLPQVKGNITLRYRGTIDGAGVPETIHIDPSTAIIKIADINQPISNDLRLLYRMGNSGAPATVSLAGTIDAVENNKLKLDKLVSDERLDLASVDLAAASPFLRTPSQQVDLAGIANGSIALKADGVKSAAADGHIVVSNFIATGTALSGDTYRSSKINLPIKLTADPSTKEFKIEMLRVETDQAFVDISGQASQEALVNLAKNQAPGADGKIVVKIETTDLPGLARQLRNTLHLQKDVQIESGKITASTDLTLAKDRAVVAQTLHADASGTNAGKAVKLDPVDLTAGATALPANGGAIPDLRDMAVALTSAFASAKGSGKSLSDLKLNASADLSKLRQQIGQFSDLGTVELAGTGDITVTSRGDLITPGGTATPTLNATFTNVVVRGLKEMPEINEPRLVADASAKVTRGGDKEPLLKQVDDVKLTVQAGDASAPVIDLLATAGNIDPNNFKIGTFQLVKLNIPSLPQAQQQFGGLVAALNNIVVQGGEVYITAAGSYDGQTLKLEKPLDVSVPNLTLASRQTGKSILKREKLNALVAGTIRPPKNGEFAANLSALSVKSSSNLIKLSKAENAPLEISKTAKGVSGRGSVTITSDLRAVNDLARAFGTEVAASTPSAGQLTSGMLDATLNLASTGRSGATISLDGTVNNLSVTTNEQPISNEKVTIAVSASSADFDVIEVKTATINSSFANTKISDAKLQLKKPGTTQPAGPWDLVQSATVDVQVPDVPKTYAIISAFSLPATQPTTPHLARTAEPVSGSERISSRKSAAGEATTQPLDPLEVASGSASVALQVKRENQTTHVTVSNMTATTLKLRRGKRSFDFDRPIDVKLNADIVAASPIQQIKVNQLSGDLVVAKLDMPTPITVTDLGGDTPNANGKIQLTGSIEPLTRLLSVVQGADPMPYGGDYAIGQNLSTKSGQIQLAGDATITKFVVLQNGKPAFTEDKIVLADDVALDTKNKNATINNVALDMASSKAASVALKGAVQDWETKRQLNGVTCDLAYDLEKLWPIIHPMLAKPGQEDSFKDLKIAGQFKRTFNLGGSYPAGKEFNEAIKFLKADGALAVALLSTSGIDLQNFEQSFALADGVVVTGDSKPARFNEGTLNTAKIKLNLAADNPRLDISKKYAFVRGASINSLLSDTLGKYVNPVFANSKRAKGLLDVTINQCQNLALGEKLKSPDSGKAVITFSLSDMDIANPVGALLLGKFQDAFKAIPGVNLNMTKGQAEVFEGYIKDAVVTIDKGRTTQNVTMQLIDPGVESDVVGAAKPVKPTYMPMSFQGDINMVDLSQLLNVSVPPQFIAKFIPDRKIKKAFNDLFPQGVPVVMRGTTKDPKVDVGNITAKVAEGFLKSRLQDSIIGGGKKEGGKDNNPLGGILDQITGQQSQPPPQPPDSTPPPPKKKPKK